MFSYVLTNISIYAKVNFINFLSQVVYISTDLIETVHEKALSLCFRNITSLTTFKFFFNVFYD